MEKQNRPKRRGLKITLIVLAVVLALVLAAVVYGAVMFSRVRQNMVPTVERPDQQPVVDLATPEVDPFTEALRTDIDYYESGEIVEVPIYERAKIDKYTYNVAVVVQQGSLNAETRQTDMIFLVSYHQLEQRLSIVAFPRDMLLPTHEYGWKRLGAIYSSGGIGMVINALNDSFDLAIQDYVCTGTEELAILADAVDGVPAILTEGEAAMINEQTGSTNLTKGTEMLSGKQAICYLSDRTVDNRGDLGRAQRQLALIQQTYWHLTDNFDRDTLFPLFTKIFDCIRTNLDWDTISGLGYEVAVANELTVNIIRMPYDDSYSEISYEGTYAILPAIEKNKILIRQALFGKE